MTTNELTDMLVEAIQAAENGETAVALPILEKTMRHDTSPVVCSYLAYCSAVENGDMVNAVMLCRQMIESDPKNPVHFLNLGRIYRHHGRRAAALKAFRDGLRVGEHDGLQASLEQMGLRKTPVCPWWPRDHVVNKHLGKLRARFRNPATVPVANAVPDLEKI